MNIRPRSSLLDPKLQRPSALDSMPRDPTRLWLDKNENLDPELAAVLRAVLDSIPNSVFGTYPEAGELYRKLARWAGVSPQSLLLTPGSDGAIRLTYEAFVEPGDGVVHTFPTFAMYPVYSRMFGALVRTIEYRRPGAVRGWSLPRSSKPYASTGRSCCACRIRTAQQAPFCRLTCCARFSAPANDRAACCCSMKPTTHFKWSAVPGPRPRRT